MVVGPKNIKKTKQLFKEGLRLYAPGKIVRLLDPILDSLRVGETVFPKLDEPKVYVCNDKLCSEPLDEEADIPVHYLELVENTRIKY